MRRIALLSDIHANILALNSVLEDLKKYEIQEFICCGDYIGYYYEPSIVISRLQSLNKLCVIGNHDLALLRLHRMTDAVQSRFLENYHRHHGSSLKIAFETLTSKQLDWLRDLPTKIELKLDNTQCPFFHGTPSSPAKYLYPTSPLSEFRSFMENSKSQLFIGGHSHRQFSKRVGQKLYINPGSVGQPRDIGGRAAWTLLRINGDDIKFDFLQSTYDFRTIAAQAAKTDPHVPSLQSTLFRGLNV